MSDSSESRKATILVADDDEDSVNYVKFRLEREGYRVLTARNGDEALELALKHQPHLAVLDVRMPSLDGFAVTRQIRANATLKSMPVILLTGNVEEEYVEQGYEAGANDYLTKPFTESEELVSRVGSALDEASGV
jgi:CheY-like chemotaxis protein